MRHVHSDEFNIAVHQVGNERDIAREAVEPGNDKHGPALPAFYQRHQQLRPISMLLAALYLDKLRDDLSAVLDISTNGFALRVHTEASDALLVGAHTEMGNEGNVN
jgi:hypothetical protein